MFGPGTLFAFAAAAFFAANCRGEDAFIIKGDQVIAGGKVYEWFGTSPFCDGSCPNGTTQITVATKKPPLIANHPGLAAVLPFGDTCWSGTKALCVGDAPTNVQSGPISEGLDCEWFGTAPTCDGECPKGTVKQMRAKDDPQAVFKESSQKWGPFGSRCWTGKKALCCRKESLMGRSADGSTSSPAPTQSTAAPSAATTATTATNSTSSSTTNAPVNG